MINPKYREQADFLLQLIPHIAKEKCFALKGGTAINLFLRDLPRLSVDIDLTYLLFDKREIALQNIANALRRIKERLENNLSDIKIVPITQKTDAQEVKLLCNNRFVQVKIEVNTTIRGHIFPVEVMQVCQSIQRDYEKFAAIQVLSKGELFGGKICAALDRQHPRDLFDIFYLLNYENFSDEIKIGFISALLSHPRPINEIINPIFKDQQQAYNSQFLGMASIEFSYEDYLNTQQQLYKLVLNIFTKEDKEFIISFKEGNPNWSLSPMLTIKDLPAVQWKLLNINQLKNNNLKKHTEQLITLKEILFNSG